MKFQQKHTLISIEGNIGSGKSTLLKMIQNRYKGFEFVAEPVNEWQCINGDPNLNLLSQFYQDPQRWAYTMQVFAFYSRLRHWKEILNYEDKVQNSKIILSERSIQADKNIFAINGFKNGLINKLEYALYNNFYDWLVDEIFCKKIERQIILYLKSDPDICYTRLQKRGRSEEKSSIKLQYLQQLHDRHEDWLINQRCGNIHILTIDGNKEFEADSDRANAIFQQIDQFFFDLQLEKNANN